MWREDHLYDVVIDLAWNRGPVVRGRGSAIFLHLARPGFRADGRLRRGRKAPDPRLLERIGPGTIVEIVG